MTPPSSYAICATSRATRPLLRVGSCGLLFALGISSAVKVKQQLTPFEVKVKVRHAD